MEINEGYSYRINIVSEDSTILVDSNSGVLRAPVVDINGELIVDPYNSLLKGSLIGNLLDQNFDIIFNLDEKSLHVFNIESNNIISDKIQATLYSVDDEILLDHSSKTISNIKVINSDKIISDLLGNVYSEKYDILIDSYAKTITNIESIESKTIYTDKMTADFVTANTLTGNLIGNVCSDDDDILIDGLNKTITNISSIIADTIDAETINSNIVISDLVGNVYNLENKIIFDHTNNTISNINIFNSDIINTDTINSNKITSNNVLADNLTGNLIGNVFSDDDDVLIDSLNKTITNISSIIAETVNANTVNAETVISDLVGNVYSFKNEIIFDSFNKNLLNLKNIHCEKLCSNNISGNLYDSAGNIILDVDNAIFYGSMYDNLHSINSLRDELDFSISNNFLDSVRVANDYGMTDDYSTLSLYNFKTDDDFAPSIVISRGYGSMTDPVSIQPGSKLGSIVFAGYVGQERCFNSIPVGLFGFQVAKDANISEKGFTGEFVFDIGNDNNERFSAMVIDSNGHTKTILKEFSVVGNTTNTPVSNEVNSWLEVVVNGEKKLIPLYI